MTGVSGEKHPESGRISTVSFSKVVERHTRDDFLEPYVSTRAERASAGGGSRRRRKADTGLNSVAGV